jgi:uncharacterized protein (TIGR03435 family)
VRVALRVPFVVLTLSCGLLAQGPESTSPTFDVVSIKPNTAGPQAGSSGRFLPDGTFVSVNNPIATLLGQASPVPVQFRNIVGYPDWVRVERYDVTAKPPAGLSQEELTRTSRQRWQAALADRLKLIAHIEQREQDVYDLVVARSDGRLGPELKMSSLDCAAPAPRPAGPPATTPTATEARNRCGWLMRSGLWVSGGMTMTQLAQQLPGAGVDGQVTNKTNLDGFYGFTLTFSPRGLSAAPNAPPDDAPDIFTAIQQQLGLKLVKSKAIVPFFVIDHIERPTEN